MLRKCLIGSSVVGGVRVGKLWCLTIGSLEPFTDSGIDVTGVPADEQPTTEFAAFVLAHERTLGAQDLRNGIVTKRLARFVMGYV